MRVEWLGVMIMADACNSEVECKPAVNSDELRIIEVRDPRSIAGQEALRLCRLIFELPAQDIRSITQNLLIPGQLFPDRVYCLAAVIGEQVVGVSVAYLLHDVKMGYLEYIAVLPEFRGRGIGHGLYRTTVAALLRDCPESGGFLFELMNINKDLIYRKEFFLSLGAIPIDLSFYNLNPAIIRSGLKIMFHPLREDVRITSPDMCKVFDNLSHVLDDD